MAPSARPRRSSALAVGVVACVVVAAELEVGGAVAVVVVAAGCSGFLQVKLRKRTAAIAIRRMRDSLRKLRPLLHGHHLQETELRVDRPNLLGESLAAESEPGGGDETDHGAGHDGLL